MGDAGSVSHSHEGLPFPPPSDQESSAADKPSSADHHGHANVAGAGQKDGATPTTSAAKTEDASATNPNSPAAIPSVEKTSTPVQGAAAARGGKSNHRRNTSSARQTPARTPTGNIPPELIPAELRSDFASGAWEPQHQKRRTHSRNVSLVEPPSESDEEADPRQIHRRGKAVPATTNTTTNTNSKKRGPSHLVDKHDSTPTAQRRKTQPAQTPAQAPAAVPHVETSTRRRAAAQHPATPHSAYPAMPGLSDKKRVKGVKITRAFRIGSEAWKLDDKTRPPGTPDDHTTGWRVYVENVDGGPDISTWLNKVQFSLHETYPNAKRSMPRSPNLRARADTCQ